MGGTGTILFAVAFSFALASTLGCAKSSTTDGASPSSQPGFTSTAYYSPINFGNLKTGDYIGTSQINPFVLSGSCSADGALLQITVANGKTTLTQNTSCSKKSDPNWSLKFDLTAFPDGPFGVGGGQFDPGGILSTVAPIALIKLTIPMQPALLPLWSPAMTTTDPNPTASWVPSLMPTLAYQRVQFYSGSACNTAVSSPPSALPSPSSSPSSSPSPAPSSAASPSPGPSVTPSPSPSPSPSLGAVVGPSASDAPVTVAASASSLVFKGKVGTWTFKVISFDKAGNFAESSCSAGLTIAPDLLTVQPTVAVSPSALFPIENSLAPLVQGVPSTLATWSSPRGATVTLTCSYQSLGLPSTDLNFAAPGTPCSQLDTLIQAGASGAWVKKKWAPPTAAISGSFTWTPTLSQRGTFQFTLGASDGVWTATPKTVIATVRENEGRSAILSWLDAAFSVPLAGLPASSGAAPKAISSSADGWLPLTTAGPVPQFRFGTAAPWSGSGTAAMDPYRLNFSAAQSDRLDLNDGGTALGTSSQWAFQAWLKPSAPADLGMTLLSNASGNTISNGMTLRQSASGNSKLELLVGKKFYSYPELIQADHPIGYWRMNDTNSTATDLSASTIAGSYLGSYTLGEAGALTGSGDNSPSVLFNAGGSGTMTAALSGTSLTQLSVEFWVKPRTLPAASIGLFQWANALSAGAPFILIRQSGTSLAVYVESGYAINPTATLTLNTWTHLVLTLNSSNVWTFYVDGASAGTFASTPPHSNQASAAAVYFANGYNNYFDGWMDEGAVYSYALSATQVQAHYQTGLSGKQVLYPLNATLADKPSGYWRLNDKNPALALDHSGSGNHLGLASSTPGKIALTLPGPISGDFGSQSIDWSQSAGQFANATLSSAALTQTDNFSLEAWVYPTSTSQLSGIVSNGVTSALNTGYGFLMHNGSGAAGSKATAYLPGVAWDATNSNTTLPPYQWTHLALTRTSGTWRFYANAVLQGTGSTAPITPAAAFVIGDVSINNTCCAFQGRIAEVATYPYPLSSQQIQNHFNMGTGAKPWFCQTQTPLSSSNWSLVQGLFDGTALALYVNGQKECQLAPGTTYNPGTTPLTLGASPTTPASGFWSGAIATLKLFSTPTGTTLASQGLGDTQFQSDFLNGSNRYRSTPLEFTAPSGVVLALDAANAKQGLGPFATGCAQTDLSWYDLSPTGATGLGLARLIGFSGCGTGNGWVGAGSPASPFALNFNGTSQYASIPLDLSTTQAVSAEFWASWTAYNNSDGMLAEFTPNTNSSTGGFFINPNPSGTCSQNTFQIATNGNVGYNVACFARPAVGTPHHLVVVLDKSKTGTGVISFYSDSAKLSPTSYPLTSSNTGNFTSSSLYLMSRAGSTFFNQGSISILRIYNRALTGAEVKQNCLAQEGRFTATAQAICGAP